MRKASDEVLMDILMVIFEEEDMDGENGYLPLLYEPFHNLEIQIFMDSGLETLTLIHY